MKPSPGLTAQIHPAKESETSALNDDAQKARPCSHSVDGQGLITFQELAAAAASYTQLLNVDDRIFSQGDDTHNLPCARTFQSAAAALFLIDFQFRSYPY